MNDMTTSGGFGGIANISALKNQLANVKQTMKVSNSSPFLRMMKDGKWVFGQENIEVEPDSEWAVNPLSVHHGWVCWNPDPNKAEKLGESMVPASQPKPDQMSLPQLAGKWEEQIAFHAACTTGEDKGVQVLYSTASTGGRNAVSKLLDVMITRIGDMEAEGKAVTNDSLVVPVVHLKNDSYWHKNKTYGRIYVPMFTIVRWASLNNQNPPPAAEAPAPKRAARTAAVASVPAEDEVPFEADVPATDAPRRRRRS